MGLQLQTAVENGQRFVKHRFMRAAARFKSHFKPAVGVIDYKRFESTKAFQIIKEMGVKRGIKVSMNPRSNGKRGYMYVPTSSILCLNHDHTEGRITRMELLHSIGSIFNEYERSKLLDNARIEQVRMSVK